MYIAIKTYYPFRFLAILPDRNCHNYKDVQEQNRKKEKDSFYHDAYNTVFN